MTLKGVNIYSAKTVDLEELVEHMTEHLEHGSIYATATLKHCRMLLEKNKTGLNFGLGIDVDHPFTIIEDSLEAHNKRLTAASAPAEEPLLHNYPTKLAFLRAKAAWNVAQSLKQQAEEFEASVDAVMTADEALDREEDSYDTLYTDVKEEVEKLNNTLFSTKQEGEI
jgi:hypothetical protein